MDPKLNNIYESLKLSNIVIQQSDIDNNVLKISDNYKKQNSYTIKQIPQIYLKLSKSRLTSMVVMTEMCGYLMAPGAFDSKIFVAAMLGTFLTSASANTINQFLEIPYDSQMNRTKNRVLVSGIISPPHAICFALVAALLGLATFFLWVNPISGLLAAFNLALYTAFYTRSKRTTILNTWIGAVVGAVPPLIGYFARYRIPELSALTNMTSEQIGACVQDVSIALLLASLLYTWQFPHFNALSWNLKHEYCRAGYRMMSAANPALCLKTAFLHSLYAFVIVTALLTLISFRFTPDSTIDRNLRSVKDFFAYTFNSISKSGANVISARVYADDNNLKLVKDERKNRAFFNPWTYFVIAGSFLIPLSLYNIHLSRKFYFAADSKTSRKLFRYSLIYLPFTLGVLLVYKTSISSQKNRKI
ncbi:protoheme IX farnesyltransferase, mitochondrial-like [Gordionus sp. m RMFG-2023]|uniref:protoheme IX farnesyltransferase, mitochondrial-like n=1 Tax=Gordionus sp. m RMFG-2023 TaxID=3053472 RepID=UPI0031FD4C4D